MAANNPFTANNTGSNPFNSVINKSNSTLSNNSNPNTSNLTGPKVFGSSNENNNLFPINSNSVNANKESKNDNQENKPNILSNPFKQEKISDSNAANTTKNNINPVVSGNSLQSAHQNIGGLFQNKDNNQGTFNKQFSFSSGNNSLPNNLLVNPTNNSNNIMNNPKKEEIEDKNGSGNLFLQQKLQNIESVQVQNNTIIGVEKKNQNPENPLIHNKQAEKANENIMIKSNFSSGTNDDTSKHESNNLNKDSKELLRNTDIKKPSQQIKENRSIEDFKIDKLMSLSIDDLINKWKLELDNQVCGFEKSADSIKNFELNFQNHYNKVGHLSELINKITENGENTLNEMRSISKEEDYIIDQLDCMERNLDKFFDIVSKNANPNDKGLSIDDNIYSSSLELDSNIKDIQKEIDLIQNNFNVQSENHAKKVDNLKNFLEKNSGESFDEKDITEILNSYFDSLRAIQLMQHSVESKVQDISFDLNENKKNY